MKKGIAVAGTIITDKIKIISSFPVRHELVKIESIELSLGGAACNVGMDLAMLDPALAVKIVGMIGEDADGDAVLRHFARYANIDASRVLREGITSFTDVMTEKDTGARSFLFYGGANDIFCQDHVDIAALDCDLFHIGYILLLKALDAPDDTYGTKMARLLHDIQTAGIQTSVDVVSEVGDRYRTLVPPSLRYADYCIINEIEGGKTVGLPLRDEKGSLLRDRVPEVLSRLRAMGVRRWTVLHAPEGGFGMDQDGAYVQCPSLSLPEGFIQGSVGAGDAFCAGILHGAYHGLDLHTALMDANAAAVCSLRRAGATEGLCTMAEARALSHALQAASEERVDG